MHTNIVLPIESPAVAIALERVLRKPENTKLLSLRVFR
jgi:hypothetical protein